MNKQELIDELLGDLKNMNDFLQRIGDDFKMIHINWHIFDTRLEDFFKTGLGGVMIQSYIKKKTDDMKEKIDIIRENIEKLNYLIYQITTSIEIINELRPKQIKRGRSDE
jgi:hypothetical protein